ncbi:MAG: translation initiation factor IF-6 [Methanolinea sp.]|nr:translation initiation factor IF-6 [Methanolinea sp.]
MQRTISYGGDPHIGVFCRVLDDIAVVPPTAPPDFKSALEEVLGVEVVSTTIQGSEIVGSLLTGNAKGFIVSGMATDREISVLEEHRDVFLLEHTMNAAGNIILLNDRFAVVHPEMPGEMIGSLKDFLGTPVTPLTVGGVKAVGMAAAATNKGVLVHPRSSRAEIQRMEEIAGVPVGTGSVNRGTGLVGTGLLVNAKGYVAGLETTGFELGRIEDVFGFLE